MDKDQSIRKHLLASLQGRNAHLTFEDAIRDFPEEHYNSKMAGIDYSCWELLEHLRIAQWDILDFIVNPDYKSMKWPDGYWPSVKGDPNNWEQSVSGFLKDRKKLEDMVQNSANDLYGPIPHAPDYTIFREIVLVIDHNSYHLGQLVMLRKGLGIWPD